MFKGTVASSTLRTSVVLSLRLVVQAGSLLLVARMLGAEGFGAFSGIAAIAVMFGSLSSFGMHLVLLRDVSRSAADSSSTWTSGMQTALPMILLFGSVLFLAFLVIARGSPAVSVLSKGGIIAIGISEIYLLPLLTIQAAELHGRERVAASQLLLLLPLVLRFLVAMCIVILAVEDALTAYVYGYLAVSFAALLASMLVTRASWPSVMSWRFPTREVLVTSGGFAAINFSRLAPLELDKALAAKFLPLETAGVYSAASRIIAAAALPITAMNLSALPRLFRKKSGGSQRTRKLISTMYAAALVCGVLLSAGLWLAAPVFTWLFGSAYQGIEGVVKLLCLVIPGMLLRTVSGNILMALGRPWWRIAFEVCGMAVLAVTAIVLIGGSSAKGMVLALVCSEWSMAIGGIALVVEHLRQTPMDADQAML